MKIFRLTVLFIPVISKDTGPPATGFRSIDGIGNNIENPKLGSYNYPYSRYNSYAEYGDGISSPSGANRPNAKVISNLLFGAEPSNLNAEPVSDFLPFWGQFIAHDVALTQENATETMPVVVNTCDFVDLDVECSGSIQYNVSRALRDKQDNEESALNFATGFIDGSVIYGSNQETNDILRTFEKGFLRTFIDPVSGSELLPIANATTFGMMASARVTAKTKLFLAGDKRANVHPALQAIHTLFVREHNRYARELYEKNKGNSTFTDGYIYERARAWVIALIQKITYSQYYPGLIGQALPAYTGYKDDVDPTPQTDFIGAAYRYGHSAVSGTILRLDENGQQVPDGHLLLRDHFFNTDGILSTNGDLDSIFRGLVSQRDQQADSLMIDDLRKHFVAKPYDLATLNIMRGRDFGIPSYNKLREFNGLQVYTKFSQITSNKDVSDRLASIYDSVWDIDPWVGGLCEDHDPDSPSHVSPLFTKIIERQFIHFRDGDRFWYERDGVLTSEERTAIQSWSLSTVVLKNTNISYYPSNPFTVYDGKFVEADSSVSSMANSLALTSDYVVEWKTGGTLAAPDVTFILCGNFKGWMSIGFNSQPLTMLNTDFIIAIPDANTGAWNVGVYYGKEDQVAPVPSTEYTIDSSSVQDAKEECKTTQGVQFKRMGTYASTSKAISLQSGSTTNMMWAYGTNQFSLGSPHGPAKRGSVSLDFFATKETATTTVTDGGRLESNLVAFHGIVMFSVFGIAFPIALFIVRYLKTLPYALRVHRTIMATGTLTAQVTMLALLLGVKEKFHYLHVKLGIAMFFLLILNSVLGKLVLGLIKIPFLTNFIGIRYNSSIHKFVGASTLILGYVTAAFGILDISEYSLLLQGKLIYAYSGWLIGLFVIFILFGEFKLYKRIRFTRTMIKKKSNVTLGGFFIDEIVKRVENGSKLLIIGDFVYDVTNFIDIHPGGKNLLESYAGVNATLAFMGGLLPLGTSKKVEKLLGSTGSAHSVVAYERLRGLAVGYVIDHQYYYPPDLLDQLITAQFVRRTVADFPKSTMQMKKDVKKDKFVNSTTKEIVKSKSVPASSIEKDNNRVGFLSNALGMKNIAENFQKGIQDNQYTNLRVQKITRVTEEGARHPVYEIQLAFERASQVMQFIPGDHITILTFNKDKDPENEEEPSTFCTKFTPINVQNNGFIRILVKVYPEDYVTNILGKLREEKTVRVRGPFTDSRMLETVPDFDDQVIMIAAGSGVTPMLLLIDYYINLLDQIPSNQTRRPQSITLIVQNHNMESIIHAAYFKTMVRTYPFIKVIDYVTNPPPENYSTTAIHGRLNTELLKRSFNYQELLDSESIKYHIYVCGPEKFSKSMQSSLVSDMKFKAEKIIVC